MKLNNLLNSSLFQIIFLSLMVLPFIILCFYNQPTPEDFVFGLETKKLGFLKAQEFFYNNWSGRFFSYAVLSLNAMLFVFISGYKITTLLLMLVFFSTVYFFVSEFIKEKLNHKEIFLFSLSVIFLYLYKAPSVSEGFYWVTASVIYHLGFILICTFLIFYHKLTKHNAQRTTHNALSIVICSLSVIGISGSSEITGVLFLMILSIILIHNFYKERKISKELVLFGVIFVISFSIAILSSGNNLRASASFPNDHNFYYSVLNSFTLVFKKLLQWIFLSPLLPITIILIPLFNKISDSNTESGSRLFRIKPIYSLLLIPVFLFVQNFIVTWNTGTLHYGRTLNISYLTFLILWFYNVIVVLNFFKLKYKKENFRIPVILNLSSYILIILFLYLSNNIKIAYSEVISGEAKRYNQEMNDRYEKIRNSNDENIKIDKIENVPQVFFLYDISEDPNNIYNIWYKEFFGKESIVLKNSEK